MIFDREQARGRLLRRLTDGYPTMPEPLVTDLVLLLLDTIDEQLEQQPVTGSTHSPVELAVSLKMFTHDAPDGVTVTCDGRELTARPYWRRQPVDDPDARKFYGGGG